MKGNNAYLESMLTPADGEQLGLPSGLFFQHAGQVSRLESAREALKKRFDAAGFLRVSPPTFEYYETFERAVGSDAARRSFTFKDKDGSLLSLRYDLTTPIARMAAMKYSESDLPLGFFYMGDVYREQPLHQGRLRQIPQAGMEKFGGDRSVTDLETILLLAESLSGLNSDYRIVLGEVSLYRALLSDLTLTSLQRETLHSILEKKDRASLALMLESVTGSQDALKTLEMMPKLCSSALSYAAVLELIPPVYRKVLDGLNTLVKALPENVKQHVIVDLGLIKDFSYYTGITLEGYISGVSSAVAHGGRYDGLFKGFGKDFPAVGFALDLSFLI